MGLLPLFAADAAQSRAAIALLGHHTCGAYLRILVSLLKLWACLLYVYSWSMWLYTHTHTSVDGHFLKTILSEIAIIIILLWAESTVEHMSILFILIDILWELFCTWRPYGVLQGILRDKHGVKKRLVVIQCKTVLLCDGYINLQQCQVAQTSVSTFKAL